MWSWDVLKGNHGESSEIKDATGWEDTSKLIISKASLTKYPRAKQGGTRSTAKRNESKHERWCNIKSSLEGITDRGRGGELRGELWEAGLP